MLESREYAAKEIDLFDAIVKLLNEGRSIHELKVADIASAAGMGKGTAYEYFSSKEEIIRAAIRYRICLEFEAFSAFISDSTGVVAMLEKSMDYIADMIRNRFSSLLVMAVSLNFSDIRRLTCEDTNLLPAIENGIREQMRIILEAGKEEGLIGPDVTTEECTLVLGGLYSGFSNEVRFLLGKETLMSSKAASLSRQSPCDDPKECDERIRELRQTVLKLVLKALR
ncbi:MAG: helix-turn-helix transcriptional regulator [Clostridiales bacterium]|nr:helix-turn-helix transcriptional regulator [Clostridiales bacterium]